MYVQFTPSVCGIRFLKKYWRSFRFSEELSRIISKWKTRCDNWCKTKIWKTNWTNLFKSNETLKVFARIAPFISIQNRKVLKTAIFTAQFSYCPLSWIFHSSHLASKIWKLVKVEVKNVESMACFKRPIKKWKTINCPCRLCRTYVLQFGFV